MVAVTSTVSIVYVVALVLLWLGSALVVALKGRWDALLVGLLLAGAIWLVAAWFPARPGSWWQRNVRPARDPGEALSNDPR